MKGWQSKRSASTILVAASTVDTSWDQFKIAAPH